MVGERLEQTIIFQSLNPLLCVGTRAAFKRKEATKCSDQHKSALVTSNRGRFQLFAATIGRCELQLGWASEQAEEDGACAIELHNTAHFV
jgi:hypothetical protein